MSRDAEKDRWSTAKLWLRVNVDAFRFDPAGYLQAVAWRVRRLRVRSRNRMAALVGRSPYAYAYWIACKEPQLAQEHASECLEGLPLIVPVVDCRAELAGLEATIASIPAGSRPVLIGGEPSSGRSVSTPRELARLLDDDREVWLCPIACGDMLAKGAPAAYGRAAADAADAAIVYGDDDLIDSVGNRREPHFKPDWNPELFENHDFLTGSCIVRVRREDLAELADEGWAEALVGAALGRGGAPVHVQRILHHRRERPDPVVPSKPAEFAIANAPLVSVIIPTRNAADLLGMCLQGVAQVNYPSVETIIVDNGSDEQNALALLQAMKARGTTVIAAPGPFNYSVLNNLAVRSAKGELLCFLNNDVEMSDPDWLALLARQAVRPDIGAVGARLLYPDGTVQHAGVFTGIGGGAAHAHRLERPGEAGYFQRSRLPQRVSAVTGACLVVAKDKFLAVGAFDEENFPVAFNDVDLCLKLNQRGWQSFYEPRATLIHHESKSRGSDRLKVNRGRFADELAALKRKWETDRKPDPYHHPYLSPFCEQFLIGV